MKTIKVIDPDAIELELRSQELLYGQGIHEGLGWWRFQDPEFWEYLKHLQLDILPLFDSTQTFFNYHGLNALDNPKQQDEIGQSDSL